MATKTKKAKPAKKAIRPKTKKTVIKPVGKKTSGFATRAVSPVRQSVARYTEPDTKKLLADDDPELLDMAQREKIPQVIAGEDGEDEGTVIGNEEEKDKFSLSEDDDPDGSDLSEEDEDDF